MQRNFFFLSVFFASILFPLSSLNAKFIQKSDFDHRRFMKGGALYADAETKLNRFCEFQRNKALRRFHRKKKRATYKLGSLNQKGKPTSSSRLKKAEKKYKKELIKIDAYCERSLKKMKKAYRKKRKKARRFRPPAKKTDKKTVPSGRGKSTNLNEALRLLNYECTVEQRGAKRRFLREKRKIQKSLGALDQTYEERVAQLNKLRKKFERELKGLKRQCKREKNRITKYYLELGIREARKKKRSELKKIVQKKKKPKKKKVKKEPVRITLDDIRLNGRLDQEAAYRTVTPKQVSKNLSRLRLYQYARFSNAIRVTLSEMIEYDSVFDLTDNYPENVEDDQEFEARLLDAYVDYGRGPVDVRVGHQQIVWGETIGLFIADIVNGRDLREYILKDFDLTRLHQWSAEMSIAADAVSPEFIVTIPRFNEFAEPGGEFEFSSPLPAGLPVNVIQKNPPSESLKNVEFGARVGYLAGGLDLGFFGLVGWDKNPVFERSVNSFGQLEFTREYKRKTTLGVVFSKDVGDTIVKGEFVLSPQMTFQDLDPFDNDGLTKKPVLDYAVGVDPSLFGRKVETNFQIIQRIIPAAPSTLFNEEEVRTLATMWLRDHWARGRVIPEIMVMTGVGHFDLMLRPKVGFEINSRLKLETGVDLFDGENNKGLFGIFKDNDRAYTNVSYFF